MAVVNLSSIANTLTTIFEDRIANQINRATVALQLVPSGDGTGKNVQWSARFGTGVGSTRADGAVLVDGDFLNDSKQPANLDYGTYDAPFAITGKALAGAMAAGNPAELENLFADELGDAVERLAKKVQQDLYTGDGSADTIFGFFGASGPLAATGTYANINRATFPQWASNVLANGGTNRALTFELMRSMRKEIYEASGEKPDLVLCDAAIHQKYGTLFGDQRRFVQEVRLRGDVIRLDGGYQVLEFDGIPVVEDVDMPANTMLFLNTRYVKMAQLPDPSNQINQSMGNPEVAGTDEEQFGESRSNLTARINVLGRDGDRYRFQLICYPQLQVRRPNAQGQIQDIDPTL